MPCLPVMNVDEMLEVVEKCTCAHLAVCHEGKPMIFPCRYAVVSPHILRIEAAGCPALEGNQSVCMAFALQSGGSVASVIALGEMRPCGVEHGHGMALEINLGPLSGRLLTL